MLHIFANHVVSCRLRRADAPLLFAPRRQILFRRHAQSSTSFDLEGGQSGVSDCDLGRTEVKISVVMILSRDHVTQDQGIPGCRK